MRIVQRIVGENVESLSLKILLSVLHLYDKFPSFFPSSSGVLPKNTREKRERPDWVQASASASGTSYFQLIAEDIFKIFRFEMENNCNPLAAR